jgi:hypothetical protein
MRRQCVMLMRRRCVRLMRRRCVTMWRRVRIAHQVITSHHVTGLAKLTSPELCDAL